MSNFDIEMQKSQESALSGSALSILEKLEIDCATIKSLKPRSKRAHYRAIINWLTKYQSPPNASDLELLRGYLESLHHFCQLKIWKSVEFLISLPIKINPPKTSLELPLHEYLIFKTLAENLLSVSNEILDSLEIKYHKYNSFLMFKAIALAGLNGREKMACDLFKMISQNSQKNSVDYIEANARLGMTQVNLGFYKMGIITIQEILNTIDSQQEFSQNLKIQELKTDMLNSIAFYEMNSSHFQKSIEIYEKIIELRKKIKLEHKLISPSVHQAILMRRKGQYKQALSRLQEAKKNAKLFKNKNNFAWIDHHMAYVLINQGKVNVAEELCVNSLSGYKDLEDKRGISDCYEQLGFIALAQNRLDGAAENFEQSLKMRQAIGNRHGVASSTLDLSLVSWHQARYLDFLYFLLKGFYLYYQIGVLNLTRVYRMFKISYIWTLGKHTWTM